MNWIVEILITAAVLLGASRWMSTVYVKNYKTAIIVAIVVGVLSFLIGWLFTFVFNVLTLGIFYFLGLGFITRTVAFAVVIEIVDQASKDFKTDGFLPSLWLAILVALAGTLVEALFY